MRKNTFLAICFSLFAFHTTHAQSSRIYTFGPTIHWYFNDDKYSFAGGLEGACWWGPGLSVDLGLEVRNSKLILYSELQAGIVFAGVSAGPFVALHNMAGGGITIGLQGSAWANFFLGIDYRYRISNEMKEKGFGTYIKFIDLNGYHVHF